MCFTSYFLNLSERNNDMDLNFNREIYDKKYFESVGKQYIYGRKVIFKSSKFFNDGHSSHSAEFGNGREIII